MNCITPMTVRDKKTGESVPVPCGKCQPCLARRVSGWSFRLMNEEKRSSSAYFVTLTYDTKFVPITAKGWMCLSKRDIQLFFKRLRKSSPEAKIKYYACGEYGSKSYRPHYHLILFNADPFRVEDAWKQEGVPIGTCHFGAVTGASIGYCLKYMMKPSRIPLHKNDDRIKEFALMSKGIGEGYITNQIARWHHASFYDRMYLTLEDGRKIAMPRYYKNKLYTAEELRFIAHRAKLEACVRDEEYERKMYKKYGDLWLKVKVDGDLNSFRKMYKDAERGRDSI